MNNHVGRRSCPWSRIAFVKKSFILISSHSPVLVLGCLSSHPFIIFVNIKTLLLDNWRHHACIFECWNIEKESSFELLWDCMHRKPRGVWTVEVTQIEFWLDGSNKNTVLQEITRGPKIDWSIILSWRSWQKHTRSAASSLQIVMLAMMFMVAIWMRCWELELKLLNWIH